MKLMSNVPNTTVVEIIDRLKGELETDEILVSHPSIVSGKPCGYFGLETVRDVWACFHISNSYEVLIDGVPNNNGDAEIPKKCFVTFQKLHKSKIINRSII